jgi:recombination associated protein RdgC
VTTNPFKAFIAYHMDMAGFTVPDHLLSSDPSGGEWRRMGFVPALKGEGPVTELNQSTTLMAVQFNERILPGKVRDEQLSKEVTRLEAAEGRKLGKKEYAQLREQVEFDLLPRAFIRRSVVPVIVIARAGPALVLICTSSQKRADDVTSLLLAARGDALRPWKIETVLPFSRSLNVLARDGFLFDEDEQEEGEFYPTDCAVLKGADKKTIRIKDKPLDDGDAAGLLQNTAYEVTELGIRYGVDEEQPHATFVLNANGTFKRVTLPDVKVTPYKEDAFGFALLCAETYKRLLTDWIAACGGLASRPASETAAGAAPVDEDDEL